VAVTTTRPPLQRTWIATKVLSAFMLIIWLLVGGLTAIGWLTSPDDSGSIRCEDGFYPASNDDEEHRCFRNGEAPASGYRPDQMTDHQRD